MNDRAIFNALLRSSFSFFLEYSFHGLHAGNKFLANWHIDLLAEDLTDVMSGKTQRLIINVPPRSLKSLLCSVAFVAWWLGHHPSAEIMCVSYAQELADKFARACRTIMESAWYRAAFPDTCLSRKRNAVSEITTTAGGVRFATSVDGVVTGRGADLIIIDDPQKPDEAFSEKLRRHVNTWFDSTAISRLNNKRTGAIVVVMQRLHEDDLTGYLLAGGEAWKLRKLAAIAPEDELYQIKTLKGLRHVHRKAGEALHPEREPLTVLQDLRQRMGETNFSGQYQQEPTPPGGGLIKIPWFQRYEPADLPATFDTILQSWDTANKASELADCSVCTTWGIFGKNIYLLHVLRKRLEYPELKRAVLEQQQLHRASIVLIEDRASGTQLIQELKGEGFYKVTPYVPAGDKIMRMHAQTSLIENGFVFLPQESPWLAEFERELSMFPHGKYDDQVDSVAQALDWMKNQSHEPGIIRYYREELERKERERQGII